MATIKYAVKENSKTGTHSCYAVPVFNGTLSFDELCEEACDDNTYSVEEMKGCVSKFMKIVQREAARGFRCKLGNDFLTIYPNITCSVKNELNPDSTVKKATTAKDVRVQNGKSRLGCTVSSKFSQQFALSVSWQRVDKDGNVIEEEDDITQGNSNVDPNSTEPTNEEPNGGGNTGGNTGGDNGGGTTPPPGGNGGETED